MKQGNESGDNRAHTADTRNPDWDKYVPEGHGRTDEQIRADVHELLAGELGDVAERLSLSVGDGIVTLRGKVASDADQRRVAEIVRSVPSVKDVTVELEVGSA